MRSKTRTASAPTRRSFRRSGRLIPRRPRGLRAGAVRLRRGGVMDWHSTRDREELLLIWRGVVRVEIKAAAGRLRRMRAAAGECLWLPARTRHRVVTQAGAAYVYVTGPG